MIFPPYRILCVVLSRNSILDFEFFFFSFSQYSKSSQKFRSIHKCIANENFIIMKSNFFHYHRYEKPFINRDTFIFRCLVGIRTEILSHFFPYIQFTRFMHLWIDLSVALMKQPIFHNMVNQFDKYLNDKRLLII